MRFKSVLLSTCLASLVALTPIQEAVAETQEFTIPNVSDTRFADRSVDGLYKKAPEAITLRVLDGSIDTATSTPSGGQFEWVISSSSSATSRTFAVEADTDVSLSVDPNSGAIVVSQEDEPVALIESPWAKDANGRAVPTYFTVEGSEFTQYVDTSAGGYAYPITADPRVNWGIVTGHIYFSKEETRRVAAGAASAMAVSPFWYLVPPPAGELLGQWWTANASTIALWGTSAVAQNKCLALKVGVTGQVIPPSLGVTPEHYTNGCV